MAISEKTAKLLWGNSAGLCAYCKQRLFLCSSETDDASLIGDMAHIVGENKGSARYDDPLPKEKRDLFENLILLCKNHHKMIDDRSGEFTKDELRKIKSDHEKWVTSSLMVDHISLRGDLEVCDIIDKWSQMFHLSEWEYWSSFIGSQNQPALPQEVHKDIIILNKFLLERIWPNRHPEIKVAFTNFREVLDDFLGEFGKHARKNDYSDMMRTEPFYKTPDWNLKRYDQLLKEFEHHARLVENLFIELCRAANYVIISIRNNVSPMFRSAEGLLLYQRGMTITSRWAPTTYRLEYSNKDIECGLYLGKKWFLNTGIEQRIFHIPMNPGPIDDAEIE